MKLFKFTQEELFAYLDGYLSQFYSNKIAAKDYLIFTGDIPIALVAHCDTVFPKAPQHIYYSKEDNAYWSDTGLGADDRAGVAAMLAIVKTGLRPTLIFTADEERGCLGAAKLVENIPNPPVPLKYIIQLDRRGEDDCVFYDCANDEFTAYISSFGFIPAFGTFSDISEICPKWKVAGVNLSVGYFNEHSKHEYLIVDFLEATIEKVTKMLREADKAPFYQYMEAPFPVSLDFCSNCYNLFYTYELTKKGDDYYCANCLKK